MNTNGKRVRSLKRPPAVAQGSTSVGSTLDSGSLASLSPTAASVLAVAELPELVLEHVVIHAERRPAGGYRPRRRRAAAANVW
jgi:hypothetical protein